MTACLSDHQRPMDRQTLSAAVTIKRRRDRSSNITRTRRRTWQLHAGLTQPHPRLLTTIRMTAWWTSKEVHQRPTDRRTLTDAKSNTVRRDRSSTIPRSRRQDNAEMQPDTAASFWTDTAPSTVRRPQLCRVVVMSRATDGVNLMGQRCTQHSGLTRARIHDRRVTSTCTSDVTWIDWHSPQQDPTRTTVTLHSNSLGPIARHGGIDRDGHREAH